MTHPGIEAGCLLPVQFPIHPHVFLPLAESSALPVLVKLGIDPLAIIHGEAPEFFLPPTHPPRNTGLRRLDYHSHHLSPVLEFYLETEVAAVPCRCLMEQPRHDLCDTVMAPIGSLRGHRTSG